MKTVARTKATEMQYGFDPINNNWSPNQHLQHAPKIDRLNNQYNQQISTSGVWDYNSNNICGWIGYKMNESDLKLQLEGYHYVGKTIEGLDAFQYGNINDFMYVDNIRGMLYNGAKNSVGWFEVK